MASFPSLLWPRTDERPPGHLAEMQCPSCDSRCEKHFVLTIELPHELKSQRLILLRCPACTCLFFDNQQPPDYAHRDRDEASRVSYYVQQGTGVASVAKLLAQPRNPPGSSYVEIGCGYGFGLDFAIRARGWQGRGIDPAPLSAVGRGEMQLPIELRFLQENEEAAASADVVLASEVIEHVTSPRIFLNTLRKMLRPGGVLILTTPNADRVTPESDRRDIVQILSPVFHLVLQNQRSMRELLVEAGFPHVNITTDAHSLIAFASAAPLDLQTDLPTLNATCREYLSRRAAEVPRDSDLFMGFAGRALFECVNAADPEGAQKAWALLVPACRRRYRLDLDAFDALPPGSSTWNLDELVRQVPVNLGMILYADSMRRLLAGTPRQELEGRFLLAVQAAKLIIRALGKLSMGDALAENIAWVAAAEALLCSAERGGSDLVARMVELPPAPLSAGGQARRQEIVERLLVTLVNARHYAPARQLVSAECVAEPPLGASLADTTRDALFALGILEIQHGADPARAKRLFARVRESVSQDHPLFWSAVRGEAHALCNMSKRGEAAELIKNMARDDRTRHSDIPSDLRSFLHGTGIISRLKKIIHWAASRKRLAVDV